MINNRPNRFLVEAIGRINSQILSIQHQEFHTALGDKVLVTKFSATYCRSWEDGPQHICAVARTHSNMVKFRPRDHGYDNARERLEGLSRRGLSARRGTQASKVKFLFPYNQIPDFVKRSGILENLKRQLMCGYSSIAQECGIPGYDNPEADVLPLVKTWLEKIHLSRWLMVIDDTDDTQLFFLSQQEQDNTNPPNIATGAEGSLGGYIPECSHGSIPITSRNKQTAPRLAPGKSLIEIGKMTEHEADQLMRAILGDDEISSEGTSLLATRLKHLPLALVQAAAFVQGNIISIGEYIQLLDKSDSALVDHSDTPHAVTATWIISFERIERLNAFASDFYL
ncbi:hypothetical protein B0J13DRAFT_581459 [Dactylonectria estremocensis]|uniref:Uncharacterized protein n=1 Tax=Dactylonectria estremocensis TaxID=1079267 RepID=A0A9P9JBK3_9HYPO|nr:hypothetical protein B0J13DRAFT_581459 [Dactylonectria estremocensis]